MSKEFEISQTVRGFDYTEFSDANGVKCTVQKSSACRDESLFEKTRDGESVIEIYDRSTWKGLNLLGQVLTQVREGFKAEALMEKGIAEVR